MESVGKAGMSDVDGSGDVLRYINLALTQREYDLMGAARVVIQAEIRKNLTWTEFFIELARRVA